MPRMRPTCQAVATGLNWFRSAPQLGLAGSAESGFSGLESLGKDIHFGIELNGETHFKYLLVAVASVVGSTAALLLERLQLFPADTAGPSVSVQSVGARFSSK